MTIFEEACRIKLRFETCQGILSAEDLWDLPLKARNGRASLDSLAVDLHRSLQAAGDVVSFVDPEQGPDRIVQLRFDVVKHVLDAKATEAARKREDKQKLLAILARKQDAEFEGKSVEELQAMIASL